MRRRDLERELRELRSILLGHEEKRQKAAERTRRRRLDLLDAVLEIRDLRQRQPNDEITHLLNALEAYLDA